MTDKSKRAKTFAGKAKQLGLDISRSSHEQMYPEDLTVIRDQNHPLYDPRVEDPLEEEFIENLRINGVLHPVHIRENGKDANGRPILVVVAGRRRVLHMVELNRRLGDKNRMKIPVFRKHGSDLEMLGIAVAENAGRKDESMLSRAWKMNQMLKLGATVEEVARQALCSVPTVRNYLSFLNLTPEAQKAIQEKKLPVSSLGTLKEIPREEQPEVLDKVLESGATKAHEVKEAVEAIRKGKEYKASNIKKMMSRDKIEELRKALLEKGTAQAEAAAAVLGFVLGHKKALADFPTLNELAFEVCKDKRRKEAA